MKITTGGISTHYRIEGPAQGPAVMLSHSLATHLDMWEPQIGPLSARYQVLLYDTVGHGGTDAPPGPYTLNQLAEQALSLIDALGIERVHFVGLSMGGVVGQLLALAAPERLAGLVLCDTLSQVLPEDRPAWDKRMKIAELQGMGSLADSTIDRWFTPPFRARNPEVVARIKAMILSTPPEGYIGCCHALADLNLTDRLPSIKAPTLILVGEEDPGTPVEASRVIYDRIAGSHLEIIPGAAHLSNIEQAAEFNRLLVKFLDHGTES